jgi:hypothetical protein
MSDLSLTLENNAPQIGVETAPSAIEQAQAGCNSFAIVATRDGRQLTLDQAGLPQRLRQELIGGTLSHDAPLELHTKRQDGTWAQSVSTLEAYARQHFTLRVLYQPVWAHALEGLKWGALIGIGLKLLDTAAGIFAVNAGMGLLFLLTLAVCFIPRIGMAGVLILSFLLMGNGMPNFFMVILGAAAAGAALACLPGMAIGGLIGLARRNQLPIVAGVAPEAAYVPLKAVALPLAGGVAILAFYFTVVSPWMVSLLAK